MSVQARDPQSLDAFFAELAAWADEAAVPFETLRYGSHDDQVVDLRRADGPLALGSVALVLHGGFWRAGFTKRNTDALSSALAQAGWTTANVEYRRLGPGAYRELLDDVAAAARLLRPAVAIGHSAGGHLALWLAAQGAVSAAVALGGVCDLRTAAAAGLGNDAVREFLGADPGDVPEADPAQQLPLGVPQLLVHGTADDRVPIEHARSYAKLAGDECRVLELDGADHFDVIDPRSAAWQAIPPAMRGLTA
jgi:acetyl esterase/lipase